MDIDGSNFPAIPFLGGDGSASTTNSKATSTTTGNSLVSRGSDVSDVTSIQSTTGSRDTRWNSNGNRTEKMALFVCQALERIMGGGFAVMTDHMRVASDTALGSRQEQALDTLISLLLTSTHASKWSIGHQIRIVGDLFGSSELELEEPSADYPTFYNACLGLERYWKTEEAIPMPNAEDTEGDGLFVCAAQLGCVLSKRQCPGETINLEWAKRFMDILWLYPFKSHEGDQRT